MNVWEGKHWLHKYCVHGASPPFPFRVWKPRPELCGDRWVEQCLLDEDGGLGIKGSRGAV